MSLFVHVSVTISCHVWSLKEQRVGSRPLSHDTACAAATAPSVSDARDAVHLNRRHLAAVIIRE